MPLTNEELQKIINFRKDLHAHPELAFNEIRTSEKVYEFLNELKIETHRGLGGTGVIGILKHGKSKRAVGLRADMDALPLTEQNHFSHTSTQVGKMHACGHDGHTAMLLGAAMALQKNKNFDGTIYLIFQPAEEDGGGANVMIKDGIFEKFPMDAIFGMHNWPGIKASEFAITDGPTMASSNEFFITIKGKGAHAAIPQDGIDPVLIACQMISSFQSIISRNKKPMDAAVLSVTTIHAGEATNIIPDSCKISGTVRTFSLEVLELIETRMKEIAEYTVKTFGAQCEFLFKRNYPPTINHKKEAQFVKKIMQEIVGEHKTHEFTPTMGAEDFSYFLLKKPGAYFVIGNGDGNHRSSGHGLGPCNLHNPSFDFNDEIINTGITFWEKLAIEYLKLGV